MLSEDGAVYGVGRWKNGRKRHDGALWLALYECHQLRKVEPNAKVVRRGDGGAPLKWPAGFGGPDAGLPLAADGKWHGVVDDPGWTVR